MQQRILKTLRVALRVGWGLFGLALIFITYVFGFLSPGLFGAPSNFSTIYYTYLIGGLALIVVAAVNPFNDYLKFGLLTTTLVGILLGSNMQMDVVPVVGVGGLLTVGVFVASRKADQAK